MKISMPIARPGHGERDPGRRIADQRQRRQRDRQQQRRRNPVEPRATRRLARSLVRLQRQPQQRFCSASSAARSAMRPLCTMRPASITATASPSERATWKFCSTSRIVVSVFFSSVQRLDHVVDDRRREALGRLVDQQRACLGSTMAREIASICFWPPESSARGQVPEFFHRRKEAEDPVQARLVERRRARAASSRFSLHREAGEDAHRLGHVGDAEVARSSGVCHAGDVVRRRSGSRPPRLATSP